MKKLSSFVRVSELDTVSDFIVALYHKDTRLVEDDFLRNTIAQIEDYSDRITRAIRSEVLKSNLDQADKKREEVLRCIWKVVQGQEAMPEPERKAAAQKVLTVLNRYKGITRKGYDEESSLIESFLTDMNEPEILEAVNNLLSVRQYLDDLRAVQDEFNQIHHDNIAFRVNRIESASSCKQPLIKLINGDLVPHLEVMQKLHKGIYDDFAAKIEEKFIEVAIRIDKRTNTDQSTTKEAEQDA